MKLVIKSWKTASSLMRDCFPFMHSTFKSMIILTLRPVVQVLQAGTCCIKKLNNLWIQLRVKLVWAIEVRGILCMLHSLIGQSRQYVICYIVMHGISSIFPFILLSVRTKPLQLYFFLSFGVVKYKSKRLNLIDTYTKNTYWRKNKTVRRNITDLQALLLWHVLDPVEISVNDSG